MTAWRAQPRCNRAESFGDARQPSSRFQSAAEIEFAQQELGDKWLTPSRYVQGLQIRSYYSKAKKGCIAVLQSSSRAVPDRIRATKPGCAPADEASLFKTTRFFR